MNPYYKILNEIASTFDMDQWDEQVNLFTDVINEQLNAFVHNTEWCDWIFILENSFDHDFPQYNFYAQRCYVNGEKVELNGDGRIDNTWVDQETVNVIIEDLDQLLESCAYMFFRCYSLISVPLFDTSSVTDMFYMFYDCDSLSEKTKKEWSSVYDFEKDDMK